MTKTSDVKSFNIDISKGIPPTKKYLVAVTSGKVQTSNPMSISICGYEQVTPKTRGTEVLEYDISTGSKTLDAKSLFINLSQSDCPIVSLKLATMSRTPLDATKKATVSMTDNSIIDIKTISATQFSFLVVARTISG